jgi:hypothetical protein
VAVGFAEGAAEVLDVVAALLEDVVVAAGVVVELGCIPITCSNDCNRLPNRFCAVATGTVAEESVVVESLVKSTWNPCLWPRGWTLAAACAVAVELKLVINDIGVSFHWWGIARQ